MSPCEDAASDQGEEKAGFATLHSVSEGSSNWIPWVKIAHQNSDEQLKGSEMALAWRRTWNIWN